MARFWNSRLATGIRPSNGTEFEVDPDRAVVTPPRNAEPPSGTDTVVLTENCLKVGSWTTCPDKFAENDVAISAIVIRRMLILLFPFMLRLYRQWTNFGKFESLIKKCRELLVQFPAVCRSEGCRVPLSDSGSLWSRKSNRNEVWSLTAGETAKPGMKEGRQIQARRASFDVAIFRPGGPAKPLPVALGHRFENSTTKSPEGGDTVQVVLTLRALVFGLEVFRWPRPPAGVV